MTTRAQPFSCHAIDGGAKPEEGMSEGIVSSQGLMAAMDRSNLGVLPR